MDISQRGLDLIKKWEAFYAHAYDDGEGVWTIGWGTIRWDLKTPVKKGDVITRKARISSQYCIFWVRAWKSDIFVSWDQWCGLCVVHCAWRNEC